VFAGLVRGATKSSSCNKRGCAAGNGLIFKVACKGVKDTCSIARMPALVDRGLSPEDRARLAILLLRQPQTPERGQADGD
jgi:hypothetical protein